MLQHHWNQSPSIEKKTEVTVHKWFTRVSEKKKQMLNQKNLYLHEIVQQSDKVPFQVPSLCNAISQRILRWLIQGLTECNMNLHGICLLSFRGKEQKAVFHLPSVPSSLQKGQCWGDAYRASRALPRGHPARFCQCCTQPRQVHCVSQRCWSAQAQQKPATV